MRAFIASGRAIVTDSKNAELRAYERDVRDIALRELTRLARPCASEQPFEILLAYYLPRSSGDFDAHGYVKAGARSTPWVKPDIDKLTRATFDALTGIVFDDDARIVRVVCEKRFATRERDIGVWIECRVRPSTVRELRDWDQLQMTA